MESWVELIVAILSALIVTIPLVVELVKCIKKLVKERNWNQLIKMILSYMEEAEEKFDDGASRKEWVLGIIERSGTIVNYDVDIQVVSDLIDRLCAMSKVVNASDNK